MVEATAHVVSLMCMVDLDRIEDALARAEDTLQDVQDYFDDHDEYNRNDREVEELYLRLANTLRELRSLTGEAD